MLQRASYILLFDSNMYSMYAQSVDGTMYSIDEITTTVTDNLSGGITSLMIEQHCTRTQTVEAYTL